MSNSTPHPKDFFISYTGRDRPWAEWIAWVLEEAGYSVVIQAWDFRPGGNFVLDMQQATQAKRTIAVLSALYLDKPFTQAEWAAAFAQDPTSRDRKLIPVRIEECAPPGLLAQIVYMDVFDCEEVEAQQRLLAAVQDDRIKPDKRPRFPGQAKATFPGSPNQISLKTAGEQVAHENSSISAYLNNVIRSLPNDQIFDEKKPLITLKDIYVQPNMRNSTLDDTANSTEETEVLNLHNWIKEILEKQDRHRKVIFVSGEAGRGKTAFCKMFANWIVDQEELNFIPVLVELRQIRVLESNLKKTLENCLQTLDFIQDNQKWLTQRSLRFLFLLDGLDELFLQESEEAEEFLEQVINFQLDRNHNHQCLITGRPLSVVNLDKDDFYWCQIEPMDDHLREQWIMNWELSVGEEEANGLRNFIQESPEDIKEQLSREPLLLYLLARLHREKHIDSEMFSRLQGMQAKIIIYRECINWVLEQQSKKRNIKIAGLSKDTLRNLIREVALCIVQSGAEVARFSVLENRISNGQNLIPFIRQVDDRAKQLEENSLNNLLATFYLKSTDKGQQGSVEFTHKSFGEFLFAERLKASFDIWVSKNKGQYIKDINQLYEEICDLLGYGSLSREIVDYLIALLTEDVSFKLNDLFERLYDFYLRWCDEEYVENWTNEQQPRSKMLELRRMLVQVSLQQVDIYAGLNVMILLFELHRYARQQNKPIKEFNFHPCGQPETQSVEEADSEKLLRIVGYSYCIHKKTVKDSITRRFVDSVGNFLSYANLASANLQSVNFSGVDLQFADLSNAVLVRADLSGAILIGAKLQGADLRSADLRGSALHASSPDDGRKVQKVFLQKAILSDANLAGLDLSELDLSEADLSGFDLREFNLFGVNLNGSILNGVNISGHNLSGFDLRNVDLRNAILDGANLTNVNFRGANLSGLSLSKFDLSGAILSETNLSNTDLSGLDLTEYDLSKVNLSNATLNGTELLGANLNGADLNDLNLYEFDLRDVDLSEAQLVNANLRKAVLDGADLTGAKISGANLALASLDGTNFRDADLSNSNLSGAYLRNANLTEANLENIQCEGTKWEGVIGLELARNLPDEAKSMLTAE